MEKGRRKFLKQMSVVSGMSLLAPGAIFAQRAADPDSSSWIGKPYPLWKEGEFDIHHIFTGVGESIFHILPDGTSLLIDVGECATNIPVTVPRIIPPLRKTGEWIARYIERVNPHRDQIDYFMISHFHEDHMGDVNFHDGMTTDRPENYYKTGITQAGEILHFKNAFDRGYPNYDYPMKADNPTIQNYRRFLKWKVQSDSMKQERFEVGRLDQIKLQHVPQNYCDFHIRNICANGEVWTGSGAETIRYADLDPRNKKRAPENPMSLAILFSYGPFRYYTGGDVSGSFVDQNKKQINIEEKVGKATGRVDVCKANHHAYIDAMVPGFVNSVQASIYIIDFWNRRHLNPTTMTSMTTNDYSSKQRWICSTEFPQEEQQKYQNEPWYSAARKESGHVVVKVDSGGKRYRVFYLEPENENLTVRAVFGPFVSGT